MKEHTTRGIICLKDDYGIEYHVSKLTYTIFENEEYEYQFIPNYAVIDLLDTSLYMGIPGLNMDLRKEVYTRKNMEPTFITERTPSKNREDLWELLDSVGMTYLNRLEWLIRTNLTYSGDRFYVIRDDGDDLNNMFDFSFVGDIKNSYHLQRKLLDLICAGYTFKFENLEINDSNRKAYYDLLYRLYKKEGDRLKKAQTIGIEKARRDGKYKGRKPIHIDFVQFDKVVKDFERKKIDANEASKQLGISVPTFYRKLKEDQTADK